jgi:hypothetical protein
MINVKTKTNRTLKTQRVQARTSFQVNSRIARGSKGIISLEVPSAGKIAAAGTEIKSAKVTARKAGRVTLEVQLKPAGETAVRRHGRIRAHIRLNYTPRGGLTITKTVPLIFGYH